MTPPAAPARYKRHRFPGKISAMESGSIIVFLCATATCKNSCSSAVSPWPTRPSASGVGSLGKARPSARFSQGVEHRQSRYRNNRCENSHRPHAPTAASHAGV